jgi:hypothetical protein
MKDKKTLAQLAVAGLLLAANMPAAMQAEAGVGREVYMAVAGCGGGSCGGGLSSDNTAPSTGKTPGGTKSGGDVADADDATAKGSGSGAASQSLPPGSSGSADGTGAKTTGGSNANS